MNDLMVFKNTEFGELGVLTIDGKEWFPATQCAKALGYKVPRKAIIDHCKEDGVTKRNVIDSMGRTQEMKYINEGNLYRLIVSSKLPSAEKFERWVFDEVLPEIRKKGSYGSNSINIEEIIAKTATAVVSEVVKQLVPVLLKSTEQTQDDMDDMLWEAKMSKPRKPTGIIHKLSPTLKNTVDDMLISRCSYADVVEFLRSNGIGISQQSVFRYYHRYVLGGF